VEQDKYEKASEILEKLRQGTSVYKYKAIWFEALNQLKQKNIGRCTELLKSLPQEAEDYQQAQKLLKKL
jgi:predicted transcriptional regulator